MDFRPFSQLRWAGMTVKGAGIAVIYCYPLFLGEIHPRIQHITELLFAPD
jgi:hypothetical protein